MAESPEAPIPLLAYAIRHAESELNAGREAGLNSVLTALGRQQAQALAARFAGQPIRAVYSSPFERCLQTALTIAAAIKSPLRLRPELFEHHHLPDGQAPDFRMAAAASLAARHSEVQIDPDLTGPVVWPPILEGEPELRARMGRLAVHLQSRWTGPQDIVLLVSHGSPIARLIDAWLSDDQGRSFRYIVDNAAVTALRFDGRVSSLICLNETSHLRGLAAPSAANFDDQGRIKPSSPSPYW